MKKKFRGGGRIGRLKATWPFVKLEISDNGVQVGRYQIHRNRIQKILVKQEIFGSSVTFIHDDSDVPSKCIFLTSQEDLVVASLLLGHFPVEKD